jgi:phospholipase/carboxylesterase
MGEQEAEALIAFVPPLLQALDRLGFVARHFSPAAYSEVMAAVGSPDAEIAAMRPRLDAWPSELAEVRTALATAADAAIAAFAALRAAPEQDDGVTAVFRALRELPKAQEALYPLARHLAPVSRFFLDPSLRADDARVKALAQAPPREDAGVLHLGGEPGARGAFSMYVPEDYDAGEALPLVFALHGGSGNGRSFLWSWVRDARSFRAIVVAPTAVGRTWALQGPDADSPNLARMLAAVRGHWNIDEGRILLSGMSDGGTFAYVSGLEAGSPFTHLAPTSAAFHPMLTQFADPERLAGLPIHITHGALDWMFPVEMARDAERALSRAGAKVTYREVADLSHTYPRELNPQVLEWLRTA